MKTENTVTQTQDTNVLPNLNNGTTYIPATDILEGEKEILLHLDMPGVSKEGVQVKLEKNVLKIEGELSRKGKQSMKPLYKEYETGGFKRSFELSNKIDQSKIEAKMEAGVLSLTLPKLPELQPRAIAIN